MIYLMSKVAGDKLEDLRLLVNRAMAITMSTPGYITGEAWTRVVKP